MPVAVEGEAELLGDLLASAGQDLHQAERIGVRDRFAD
jgi:hypothetical protein